MTEKCKNCGKTKFYHYGKNLYCLEWGLRHCTLDEDEPKFEGEEKGCPNYSKNGIKCGMGEACDDCIKKLDGLVKKWKKEKKQGCGKIVLKVGKKFVKKN